VAHGRRERREAKDDLTVEQTLEWADAHHARTRQWPTKRSGAVRDAPGETWVAIDAALRGGFRGLPKGLSLSTFLVAHERRAGKDDLTVEQILVWAKTHHARTSEWPAQRSGVVHDAEGEAWTAINEALRSGFRGLPKGSSLSKLLVAHGLREAKDDLTVEQILKGAEAHHAGTGKWPTTSSGVVDDAPGETWVAIDAALRGGVRGLPKGSSLSKLLVAHGRREAKDDLTVEQILKWADAHHARTGDWPTETSGVVHDAPGENWRAINAALRRGSRGLPKGASLLQFLMAHGRREAKDGLTVEQILKWANAHYARKDKWPTQRSGVVHDAPGENWRAINAALRRGSRGLPKGSSLLQFLVAHGRFKTSESF
jgi:hypothetical protein